MPDILLIQPPVRDFYLTAKRTIPYGLACIASVLLRDGLSVEILDCLSTSKSRRTDLPCEMTYLSDYYGTNDVSPFALFHHFKHFGYGFESIGKAARKSGAYLVGISSLFTAYSGEALKAAEAVKEFHPDCTIVLGGHHATEMPERIMECEAVDYVLRGEGEVSMPKLAGVLKSGRSVDSVPGIVFRTPGGGLEVKPPAFMDSLESYPAPATHLLEHDFYVRKKRGSAVIVASRGCPMKCTYCSVGASSHIPYRRRSVESVLTEIEEGVSRHGVGFIDFEDENISLQRQWFLDLLKSIRKSYGGMGLELRAMNGLFPPSLDEEVIRTMKEAGFGTLNLSLGTTNHEQLKRFKRPDARVAFDRALSCASMHGLQAVGYIIVGAPGQDPMDSVSDLLYMAQRTVLAGVSVYYPSPGSADFERCRALGVLPEKLSLMRSTALPISHTTTRDESVTLLRLGRLLNFVKSILDKGETVPEPSPFREKDLRGVSDRLEIGRLLLGWFFHDGILRGVTREGELFVHRTSPTISKAFRDGFLRIKNRF